MSFINNVYKDTAANSIPNDVINLRRWMKDAVMRAVRESIVKGQRSIQGYYNWYAEAYGDSYPILSEEYHPITSKDVERFGIQHVKRMLEQDLRDEIGLRNFEVRFIPITLERKVKTGQTFLGNPKYSVIVEPAYKLWLRGSW